MRLKGKEKSQKVNLQKWRNRRNVEQGIVIKVVMKRSSRGVESLVRWMRVVEESVVKKDVKDVKRIKRDDEEGGERYVVTEVGEKREIGIFRNASRVHAYIGDSQARFRICDAYISFRALGYGNFPPSAIERLSTSAHSLEMLQNNTVGSLDTWSQYTLENK